MAEEDRIVHVITVIDGETEEMVDLVELKSFVLSEFHIQFDVDPLKDPHMLDRYSIGPDDHPFLEKVVGKKLAFDFTRFAYFIEAAKKGSDEK